MNQASSTDSQCDKVDGIAVVDGKTMGSFVLHHHHPYEQVVVTFQDGLSVREFLDDIGDRGLKIELIMTPAYETD